MRLTRYDNQSISQIENFDFIMNNLTIESLIHGQCDLKEDWIHKEITSPFHRLYFILSGRGKVYNSEKTVPLVPGKIYLIPANSTWSYASDPRLIQFFIHFKVHFMRGVDIFDGKKECMILDEPEDSIRSLLDVVRRESPESIVLFKSALYGIIARYIVRYGMDIRPHMERVIKYEPLFKYINENCSAELQVSEVVKMVNYSQSTLYRSLKEDTGYSIKSYIDKTLVMMAQEYLLLSDKTIKEIAFAMKFKDQYYFSRFFKKHTGKSPLQYRRDNLDSL